MAQYQSKPYAANLRATLWQIVIPIGGRLSPLVWNSNFATKKDAELWLDSDVGRDFVTETRSNRRLPAGKNLSSTQDEMSRKVITSKVFGPETWEADRLARFRIPPLVRSFHSSVPSLAFLHWTIEDIQRGQAVTRLPLNVESSNQYITQQAALMLLAADYTGGIALSTLFRNAPVIGFHPQKDLFGAYLWGAGASIKWLRPSTDDLILKATIPERDWDNIAHIFERGEDVNYKTRIKMLSGNRLCAVADFQYWARNSHALVATGRTLKSTHHMLAHKVKTSARLIAGLRAELTWTGKLIDPFAYTLAGSQGRAMARKFSRETPQLADLVLARTLDCDMALRKFSTEHQEYNVINIGAGYDARPWRMANLREVHFVHLDLPLMVEDSEKLLPALASPYHMKRVPFDINGTDLHQTLLSVGVHLSLPSFVIWEGGSMYFTQSQASSLFKQVRELLGDVGRLWFDQASLAAISDRTGLFEVKAFMDAMRTIGEPFVRGFEDVAQEIASEGFSVDHYSSAKSYIASNDPIFQHYSFAVCRASDIVQATSAHDVFSCVETA